MPAPLDISRDAAKTLCLAIGMRPAARQSGIPLGTLSAWSSRDPNGPWLRPRSPKLLPPTIQPQTLQTNASEALKQHLASDHTPTKIDLSKYVRDAARVAAKSNGNHKLARSTKDIADIMVKVHGEEQRGSSSINIGVLTGQVAIQYKQ